MAFLVTLAVACSTAPERPPGYVVVGLDAAPTSLDPRSATDASSSLVLGLVHRGLTDVGPAGDVVPDLAAGWETPDATTFRFHLGPARFHDGSPVTAADVVATYRSLDLPALRARRHEALDLVADVVAEDRDTVRFDLRRPSPVFLNATRLGIVPSSCAATPDCRIGAGPFRLAAAGLESIELVASGTAARPPRIPGVLFRVSPDGVSRALELARGGIDMVQNAVEPDLLPWLRTSGLDVVATPGSTFHYLGLNVRRAPLDDLRVRRAIAHAIDRQAVVAHVLEGHARPADELFPPEHWAHGGVEPYRYDPALSRRLLAEVGRPVRLTLKVSTIEIRRRIGEVIAAMLGEVGIAVEIRPLEWATLYGDIRRGSFETYLLAWVGIVDPDHYFAILHSSMTPPRGSNRGWFVSAEIDRLTERGRRTVDLRERRRIYREVAWLVHEQVPFVPLWWTHNVVVKSERLAGFEPSPSGDLRWLARARWLADPG